MLALRLVTVQRQLRRCSHSTLQDFLGVALQRQATRTANMSRREEMLSAFSRGLEAARAGGGDVWTARLALQIAEGSFQARL